MCIRFWLVFRRSLTSDRKSHPIRTLDVHRRGLPPEVRRLCTVPVQSVSNRSLEGRLGVSSLWPRWCKRGRRTLTDTWLVQILFDRFVLHYRILHYWYFLKRWVEFLLLSSVPEDLRVGDPHLCRSSTRLYSQDYTFVGNTRHRWGYPRLTCLTLFCLWTGVLVSSSTYLTLHTHYLYKVCLFRTVDFFKLVNPMIKNTNIELLLLRHVLYIKNFIQTKLTRDK